MRVKTSKVIVEKAKAGYSGLYILSQEATRTIADLLTAAVELKRRVFVWTIGEGLWEEFPEEGKLPDRAKTDEGSQGQDTMPGEVLEMIPKMLHKPTEEELQGMPLARRREMNRMETKAIFVLTNFHHFVEDPLAQARILKLVQQFKSEQKILIILTPVLKLPIELEKEFALVETELPDKEDLAPILDVVMQGVRGSNVAIAEDRKKKLLEAALGLTTQEAENAFALSYVRPKQDGRPDDVWDPTVVMAEKCATLRKSGLLEFYPPGTQGLKAVGGLQGLKDWINRRKRAFTDAARAFGLPPPKGVLLVGVSGTGKSLGARAIAEELELPLLRCDMGRIYAGLVGASEANVRAVIRTAEAVAPCVLWLDEIEKGIAGAMQSNDSGVGARVLGTFLTWMQEKVSPVFTYATANNISALPPEFLRKGRFDEIFGVDLPTASERKEIWHVQLRKFNRHHLIRTDETQSASLIDVDHFVNASNGYSGAEIESIIKEALFMAFSEDRDLNTIDLQEAADSMIPLSTTMAKEVEAIREWVKKRARMANIPEAPRPQPQTQSQGAGQRVVEA